ncbi:hypothetical protein HMPREF9370_0665 [Neisseria wadsworthii 9715]|uniref:Uncharacterized protein n=1 Tax=Neisseria wadsworthii 9715 TaxID=1030841 RepID=G4CNK6_9NEIS|nr:hypothetical protein HMPREF9370_0665 [Neisseria wadsworthii 9715]
MCLYPSLPFKDFKECCFRPAFDACLKKSCEPTDYRNGILGFHA